MRPRAFVAIAFVGFVAAVLAVDGRAIAQAISAGPAAPGVLATAACLLTGDANCTFTGGGGIRGTSNSNFPVRAQGTGQLVLGVGSTGLGRYDDSTATQRGAWSVAANSLTIGVNDLTAGQISFGVDGGLRPVILGDYNDSGDSVFLIDVDTNLAGSYRRRFAVGGHGAIFTPRETDATTTCAAGVATINPDATSWKIDANAAACAVTVQKTYATTYDLDYDLNISVTNPGVGATTLPATAGTIVGPVACTTTGIIGGLFWLHYSGDLDEWIIEGCQVK